jgi:hypothetical protein
MYPVLVALLAIAAFAFARRFLQLRAQAQARLSPTITPAFPADPDEPTAEEIAATSAALRAVDQRGFGPLDR